MWKPDDHPRDRYGRFRLKGVSGVFDRLLGRVEAQHYARRIAEAEAAGREVDRIAAAGDRDTPQMRTAMHRRAELRAELPEAYRMGMRPHDDGAWYPDPDRATGVLRHHTTTPHDAQGHRIPPAALAGMVRVGDQPDPRYEPFEMPGELGPMAKGVWHVPGEFYPGGIPKLRDDFGQPFGERADFMPGPARSRRHRSDAGPFARAETRAERFLAHRLEPETGLPRGASAEVEGALRRAGTNPVGRRRTARVKRKRAEGTMWIQRIIDQVEGRRG